MILSLTQFFLETTKILSDLNSSKENQQQEPIHITEPKDLNSIYVVDASSMPLFNSFHYKFCLD